MAPTLVASYFVNTGSVADLTSLVTPSFTPAVGEVIVVKVITSWTDCVPGTPTGGGLTYTKQISWPVPDPPYLKVFTAVTVSASSMTVTVPVTGTAETHLMVVERWSGAQLAATPTTVAVAGSGAPSATLTTTAANSVVSWFNVDAAVVSGAGRVYRTTSATPVEDAYFTEPLDYTIYSAYQSAASAGSQTFGLTAPAGQTWRLFAIEIQAAAGGGSTTPARIDATSHGTSSAGAATNVVPRNVTPTQGNLLLAWVIGDSKVTPPGDWTAMLHRGAGGEAYIYYKIAGASEPSSVTFTAAAGTPQSTAGLIEYSGVDQNNPVADGQSSTRVAGSYTASTAAPATTTAANGLIVAFIARHGVLSAGTNTNLTNSFASVITPGQSGTNSGSTWAWVAELFPATAGTYSTVATWSPAVTDAHELVVAFNAEVTTSTPTLGDAGQTFDSLLVAGPTTKILAETGGANVTLAVAKSTTITKYAAGYYPIWQPMPRLVNVNQNYKNIILFETLPVGGASGSGALQWDSWDDTNGGFTNRVADIATCRGRGQKIIMSIGGDAGDMNFTSRAKSQTCIDSIKTLATALGGIDGIDWDNYENVSPVTAEYVWMGQQLKSASYFGSSFIIQSAVGPWRAAELTGFFTSLFNGGALDYVMPMDYADPAFNQNFILNDATEGLAAWAVVIGGYPRLVIGFGIDDTLPADYMTSAEILSTWNAAIAAHPTIAGAACWNIYDDIVQSSGAANSVATGTMAAVLAAGTSALILSETGTASDTSSIAGAGGSGYLGGYLTGYAQSIVATPQSFSDGGQALDALNVVPSPVGIGGYFGGYFAGYVQGGIIAIDGVATIANTGASQTATQLNITMPVCQPGSVVVIGAGLRINGVSSGAAICTPPGTVIERAHLQRDAAIPVELFVWTWVSNGTTPTYTFAFTGPAGNTGYAISLVAQGYQGVDVGTPIDTLSLLAETPSVATHTTSAVVSPATTSWGIVLFADRNSTTWTPVSPLAERADTAGGIDCASVELCDTGGGVTAVSHAYASTGTATTAVAVMALGYLRQAVANLVNVTFFDGGHFADTFIVAADIPLGDVGAVADSQTAATAIVLSDTGIGAEDDVASAVAVLGESGLLSDTFAVASPRTLGEIASSFNTTSNFASNLQSDNASVFDDIDATALSLWGDSASAFDNFAVAVSNLWGDAATAFDDIDVAVFALLGDNAIVFDVANVVALGLLGDNASAATAFYVATASLIVDTGSGGTTYTVVASAALSDTSAAEDVLAASAITMLDDAGTGTDSFSVSVLGTPVLAEAGGATDTFDVVGPRPSSDGGASFDMFSVIVENLLGDSASTFDEVDLIASNMLTDSASTFDDVDLAALTVLSDDASVFEMFSVAALNAWGDAAVVSAMLNSIAFNLLVDGVSASDTLQVAGPISLDDGAAAFETFNVVAFNTLGDNALGAEAFSVAVSVLIADSATSSDDVLQVSVLKLLDDAASVTDLTIVDASVVLTASATGLDTVEVAGVLRAFPRGIGITVILASGGSAIRMAATGITSTVVRADNSQSKAAPQGDRGNSSAVVQ